MSVGPTVAASAATDSSLRQRAALLVIMAVWGLNIPVVTLLTTQWQVQPLATLRMFLATGVMVLFCHRQLPLLLRLDRRQWLGLLACAALMVYANQLLSMSGMALTAATNSALIASLAPIVGTLIGASVSERVRPLGLLGLLLGFGGVAVVVLSREGAALTGIARGDLLVLLSVFAFTCGSALVPRIGRQVGTVLVATAAHGIGALMLLVHTLLWVPVDFTVLGQWSMATWGMLLLSGGVANGIGLLVWVHAVSRLGVAQASSAQYWVPIFGIGFAVLAGDRLTTAHLVGLACVVAGTWLSTHARSRG